MTTPTETSPGTAPRSTGSSTRAEPATETAEPKPAPEQVPTARAPAWAWVAITLLAAVLAVATITFVALRKVSPTTPAAVTDMETLVTELSTLNGYLETTNQLMSNAITNGEQMSATAQAQLATLQTQLAGLDSEIDQARASMGSQLSTSLRNKLDKTEKQLQSRIDTLSGRTVHFQQNRVASLGAAVGSIGARLGTTSRNDSREAGSLQTQIRSVARRQAHVTALGTALRVERLRVDRLQRKLAVMQRLEAQLQAVVNRVTGTQTPAPSQTKTLTGSVTKVSVTSHYVVIGGETVYVSAKTVYRGIAGGLGGIKVGKRYTIEVTTSNGRYYATSVAVAAAGP